jgi:hypothetical protein
MNPSRAVARQHFLNFFPLPPLVKKGFDRGYIDSHVLGFDHFEQDLRRGIAGYIHPSRILDPKEPVERFMSRDDSNIVPA